MAYVPASPEEIDAAWLTEALGERHPGVRVAGVEILERHEVTNAHALLKLRYDEPAGAPGTLFCKLLPCDPERRPAIAATGMGLLEARFYERLAPGIGMRVPRAHAVRYERESGAFALLIEDLAASGCTVSDGTRSVPPDSAARALEDLAELHLRFEDPARRRAEAGWVPEPGPPGDYGTSRLRFALENRRERLGDAFAELAELYVARSEALHALWHAGPGPRTVVHGDAHIGNLFDDAGRTGFLDWGIVCASTPLRDASYFLCMALSVEDRRARERELLRHYLDARAAGGGAAISFDEAWTAHRLQAAYLVPACCQVATFPEDATPRRRVFAAAFLARAEAALEDLEVRAALRESAGI